ncbi:hypothetical protein [Kitasatospora griseola]|uniref:hypothetical protein n=1 Tax=Kitasatospora griseola TaxID=2064 RepID=UPI0016702E75|nr:hypothetical protein [Kitasatospora griseola]GGR09322.1 hypothetical protein GCM10010195_74720 [Kitasatospora griseola]
MNTSDLVTAAVLFGPGTLALIPHLASQRASRADSARVNAVLDLSAHDRATAAEQNDETPAPPGGGEPLPQPVQLAPVQRLAPVVQLATRRAA